MTAPVTSLGDQRSDRDDDLLHTVCSDCDPDMALCGRLVPGDCWTSEGLECVVCEDLSPAHECSGAAS